MPPTSLFLSPDDFCDAFCVAGVPLGAPATRKSYAQYTHRLHRRHTTVELSRVGGVYTIRN